MNRTLRIVTALRALATIPAESAMVGAVRTVVSSSRATGALGYVLELSTVDDPAGTPLPVHHHPGSQVSRIMTGTLRSTVVEGGAWQNTPDGTDTPTGRIIRAGTSVNIEAGHGLAEPPGMQHYGATPGDPVIVTVSILRPKHQPGTIVVP